MATTDLTNGASGKPWAGFQAEYQIYNRITIPLTGVTNDVLKALPIPAGTLVKATRWKIITQGAGTTISLDLGYTGHTADFDSAFDGKSAVATFGMSTPSDTAPAAGGAFFAAAGTVDLLLHTITAMTTGTVLDVWAACEDMNLNKGGTNPLVNQ